MNASNSLKYRDNSTFPFSSIFDATKGIVRVWFTHNNKLSHRQTSSCVQESEKHTLMLSHAKKVVTAKSETVHNCPNCGSEFVKHPHHNFCSKQCKQSFLETLNIK